MKTVDQILKEGLSKEDYAMAVQNIHDRKANSQQFLDSEADDPLGTVLMGSFLFYDTPNPLHWYDLVEADTRKQICK